MRVGEEGGIWDEDGFSEREIEGGFQRGKEWDDTDEARGQNLFFPLLEKASKTGLGNAPAKTNPRTRQRQRLFSGVVRCIQSFWTQ